MHKLAKGLKKKKKKKDKKGADEDFDPEELERYKRDRAEALQKQLEASGETSGGASNNAGTAEAGSDEWKKFAALTAGVDSILKKTQGDLDRIKSTSFFQRKPVESEVKGKASASKAAERGDKWSNFDKDGNPIQHSDDEDENKDALEKAIVEVPDDDDEQEDSVEEDIFDTTYIDVLQNIDVQLAYIPDSPTEEELGDDPFDTTNADTVLKTVDKKTGKKLVSLGNAVEVLAGRIDHVSTCKIGRNRKRANVDLLLDEGQQSDEPSIRADVDTTDEVVTKTLLDDDTDQPDVPVDLTQLPPAVLAIRPVTPVSEQDNTNTEQDQKPAFDLSEFETLKEKTILEDIPDLGDDEFDLGAADVDIDVVLDECDDPFAEKESANPEDLQDEIVEVNFDAKANAEGEDPFDTGFAENYLPGKTELKYIEKELNEYPVSDVSISLTDPAGLGRDYETGLLKLTQQKKHDLLAGSNTDLSQLADEPIAPIDEIVYVDPFDTSAIKELPPNRVELKFLEKEILGDTPKPTLETLDDDDFDPRKDEINTVVQTRKPSRPEALGLFTVKNVEFTLPTPADRSDLLTTSEEEKNIPAKPLTPYYSQKSLEEALPKDGDEDDEEVDPFDTNFVANIAPGKTELKLLESELITKEEPTFSGQSCDNVDRVPEKIITTDVPKKRSGFANQRQESILDAQVDVATKPLTPNIEPKLFEVEEEISYQDPFDTSIAKNILPGKTELKLLENELSQLAETTPVINPLALVTKVIEDDEFDPRSGETRDYLSLEDQHLEDKVLTPLQEDVFDQQVDPFDTSFATTAPGKAELKVLESELVTD